MSKDDKNDTAKAHGRVQHAGDADACALVLLRRSGSGGVYAIHTMGASGPHMFTALQLLPTSLRELADQIDHMREMNGVPAAVDGGGEAVTIQEVASDARGDDADPSTTN